MKSSKRSKKKRSTDLAFWGMLAALLVVFISSAIMILTGPGENTSSQIRPSPEELSKRLIEVKKDPLPEEWKKPRFLRPSNETDKQTAAVDLIYNQMLSQIEPLLGIPMELPETEVTAETEKNLIEVYGSLNEIPQAAYRIACLRIYNTQVDFRRFYKGGSKKVEAVVFKVMSQYYNQGKPPSGLSMSAIEKYIRKHSRKKKTSSSIPSLSKKQSTNS